jgi:hypothetical protein
MTKITRMLLAYGWIASMAAAFGFESQGNGKAKGKEKGAEQRVGPILPESEPVFIKQESVLIRNWSAQSKGGLPPGLEKQLVRRGTLPPGLQKKIQPLPPYLEMQLRVLPTGYRRVIIGGNIILMNERTGLIYDILRDILH